MSAKQPQPPLVVGLNAALQRRVALGGELRVGSVNRAAESSSGVGGKGQGAYLATEQLWSADAHGAGAEQVPRARLVQFYGKGDEGAALARHLRAAAGDGADDEFWFETAAPTRICTTLVTVATGEATEIVEPSGAVDPGELDSLMSKLRTQHNDGAASAGVLFMGSMPPGCPSGTYAQILQAAGGADTKIVIDSVAGVPELLAAAANIGGSGALLKLNARELLTLAPGAAAPSGSDSKVACDVGVVAAAAKAYAASLPSGALSTICWTDGPFPAGALDVASGRSFKLTLPPLPGPVLSPIGAGDAVAGGTFSAWLAHKQLANVAATPATVQAFALGLACGSASCLTASNSKFDLEVMRSLYGGVVVSDC